MSKLPVVGHWMFALAGDSDGESGGGAGPLVGPAVRGPGRIAQARHPPPPLEASPPKRCKFQRQVPVKKVMRWVEAAPFLKSTKKIKEAAVAFSLALQEDANDDDAAVALAQGSVKCRELLRQARYRIDAMAMLGFRAYWKDLVDNDRVDAVNLWMTVRRNGGVSRCLRGAWKCGSGTRCSVGSSRASVSRRASSTASRRRKHSCGRYF